jgi:hypothetical protein
MGLDCAVRGNAFHNVVASSCIRTNLYMNTERRDHVAILDSIQHAITHGAATGPNRVLLLTKDCCVHELNYSKSMSELNGYLEPHELSAVNHVQVGFGVGPAMLVKCRAWRQSRQGPAIRSALRTVRCATLAVITMLLTFIHGHRRHRHRHHRASVRAAPPQVPDHRARQSRATATGSEPPSPFRSGPPKSNTHHRLRRYPARISLRHQRSNNPPPPPPTGGSPPPPPPPSQAPPATTTSVSAGLTIRKAAS